MEIYIDESGSFARSSEPGRSISCVSALVVPSFQAKNLFARADRICKRLGVTELKGRELSEDQIAEVVRLCRRFDLLLIITATDLNHLSANDVGAFKGEQAARLVKGLTSSHSPAVHVEMAARGRYVEGMSDQLFIQGILTIELMDQVLRDALLYYCQRKPEELSSFRWRVDAKEPKKRTEAEELWTMMLRPVLQLKSLLDPHIALLEGDYSHFRAFQAARLPEYVREMARADGIVIEETSAPPMDLRKVLRDFRFDDSRNERGLQLVDVLGSAARRGMMKTLKRTGWRDLGRLMLAPPKMTRLRPPGDSRGNDEVRDSHLKTVLAEFHNRRKRLIPRRLGRNLVQR